MNGRTRVLEFLEGKQVDRLVFMPITMMFAADQVNRAYREYVTDYRVLTWAQMETAAKFDIDYVSCISDPAREASDCGASINFFDDQPPAIDESRALLGDKVDLLSLSAPDPVSGKRMSDRLNAIREFRSAIGDSKLIEGWIEGPCAEGADLRGINNLMLDFFDDGPFVRDLFEFVTEMELSFAKEQVAAGVDLIGIGDAASSLVGPRIYEEFVWPHQKKMVDSIHQMGALVRLHICGNTSSMLQGMGALECEIVDLDYMVSVAQAREVMGDSQVLLGNLDPVNVVMKGSSEQIKDGLAQCFEEAGPRYIVGAGCEVPRSTSDENFRAMLEFARSHRP